MGEGGGGGCSWSMGVRVVGRVAGATPGARARVYEYTMDLALRDLVLGPGFVRRSRWLSHWFASARGGRWCVPGPVHWYHTRRMGDM